MCGSAFCCWGCDEWNRTSGGSGASGASGAPSFGTTSSHLTALLTTPASATTAADSHPESSTASGSADRIALRPKPCVAAPLGLRASIMASHDAPLVSTPSPSPYPSADRMPQLQGNQGSPHGGPVPRREGPPAPIDNTACTALVASALRAAREKAREVDMQAARTPNSGPGSGEMGQRPGITIDLSHSRIASLPLEAVELIKDEIERSIYRPEVCTITYLPPSVFSLRRYEPCWFITSVLSWSRNLVCFSY